MQTGREFAQAAGARVIARLLGSVICFLTTGALGEGPLKLPNSQLEPIKWSDLAGWTADDHLAAFAAFQKSCQALLKIRSPNERRELSAALAKVCRNAANLRPQDMDGTARAFFEQNFQPVRIGKAEGHLTGYFEPIVAGSRFPTPEFHVPLYRRPRDLVVAGYKPDSVAFPNKGVRVGRRNENNELVPYYDRGAIEAGALDGRRLEICWVRDPLDLLAIQLEGSGRVILEDGTPIRVSFDSHNGYAYSSIERVLISRTLVPGTAISPQGIRDWMAAHPEKAAKVRAANRSYVFFRVTGLTNEGEPVGAQRVPLTPGRTIAVGREHAYGTPFFIEADLPIEGARTASPFRRLMIAQDTGSAIGGPARADVYWGAGEEAGRIAGRIRHPGRFVMLLPRELDIAAAGRALPLPVQKPKVAALAVEKHDRGEAETVSTAAAGGQRPSLSRKPSIVARVIKQRDDKATAKTVKVGVSAVSQQKPSHLPNITVAVMRPNNVSAEAKKKERKIKLETVGISSGAIAAGLHKPSPKTKVGEVETKKQSGKNEMASARTGTPAGKQSLSSAPTPKIVRSEVKKPSGKGKVEAGKAGQMAAGGKQKPLVTKSKTPAIEAKKPDVKGKGQTASAAKMER